MFLSISVTDGQPQTPLTRAMLEPCRDDPSGDVRSGLARKLYRHAHNKIADCRLKRRPSWTASLHRPDASLRPNAAAHLRGDRSWHQ